MTDVMLRSLKDWLVDFLTRDLVPEIIGFLIVLLLGSVLAAILKRVLGRLQQSAAGGPTAEYVPWLQNLTALGQQVARPLMMLVLGYAAIVLYAAFNMPHELLDWVVPFFGIWLLQRLVSGIIRMRFKPDFARIWNDLVLRPIIVLLIVLQGFGLLDNILDLEIRFSEGVLTTFGTLLLGLAVLVIFVLLSRYVSTLLRSAVLPQLGIEPSLQPVIATFSGYLVVAAGVLVGLTIAGVSVTTLAVILGGLSVGLGFGLQELVNNFVSGFILLVERSLVPGDIVKVGDDTGVVQEVRLRTTQIQTTDNVQLIVPNGTLLGNVMTNYARQHAQVRRRIHILVGASYDDEPSEVLATLLEAAKQPNILEEPAPSALLTEFGENSINYELVAWVGDAGQASAVSSALRLKIWNLFRERRIEMPNVQRDLHIRSPLPFLVSSPTVSGGRAAGSGSD